MLRTGRTNPRCLWIYCTQQLALEREHLYWGHSAAFFLQIRSVNLDKTLLITSLHDFFSCFHAKQRQLELHFASALTNGLRCTLSWFSALQKTLTIRFYVTTHVYMLRESLLKSCNWTKIIVTVTMISFALQSRRKSFYFSSKTDFGHISLRSSNRNIEIVYTAIMGVSSDLYFDSIFGWFGWHK